MVAQTLAAALEREHHEIDAGIDAFVASLDSPAADTAALSRAMAGLRRHIYLEEQFLFPPMRSGGLVAALFVMVREHGQMWKLMDQLDGQIGEAVDRALVQDTCRRLVGELKAHNPKEEQIVYPQADDQLDAGAAAGLAEFIATGTMPDGWVCQGASGKMPAAPFAPRR